MSTQITEAMAAQYSANFHILAQQKRSRFEAFCQMEPNIVGSSKAVERIGKIDAYNITTRHADTVYGTVPHSRRWIDLSDKGQAELVDELDKIKMLGDPTSPYVGVIVAALNRAKDDVILAAVAGSARTNSGTVALPTAQKITEAGTNGLTLAKLLSAKELLDAAEVDIDDGDQSARVIAVSAKQLTNLLGTTEIKSIDYNSVKALAQGQVDTFLGFKFVRTERLAKTGNLRQVLVWAKSCVAMGIGKDVVTSIDPLPHKNYSVQVYGRMSMGAVRVDDQGVVAIDCYE